MDRSYLYDTFARAPLAFERGEGAWVETMDGRRLLDFSGGIAVNALGHAHPNLVAALNEPRPRSSGTPPTSSAFPAQERLAETLCRDSFADTVFFTNSGAEAIECAIKTARRYHFVNGHPERFRIITFAGAFHGRTLAALAATGNPKYLEGFGPVAGGFDQVAARRPQGGRGGDRTGDRGDPDRADPGRGRRPPRLRPVPARSARALRPARPAARLRRGPDRHRPHRQALRL